MKKMKTDFKSCARAGLAARPTACGGGRYVSCRFNYTSRTSRQPGSGEETMS